MNQDPPLIEYLGLPAGGWMEITRKGMRRPGDLLNERYLNALKGDPMMLDNEMHPRPMTLKVKVYGLDAGYPLIVEDHVSPGRGPQVYDAAFGNVAAIESATHEAVGRFLQRVREELIKATSRSE